MPMNRDDYPDNWEEISNYIRFERAQGKCEFCGAAHGKSHPITGSIVVLTTAHLDHNTLNNNPNNLRALCQKCHLTYDAQLHARHAKETKKQQLIDAGQLLLFKT